MLLAHSMLLLLPLPVRGADGGGQVVCRTVCVGGWVGGRHPRWVWGVKVYLLLPLEERDYRIPSPSTSYLLTAVRSLITPYCCTSTTLFVDVCAEPYTDVTLKSLFRAPESKQTDRKWQTHVQYTRYKVLHTVSGVL